LTVRGIAARHLGRLEAPEATEHLIPLLERDENPDVRMAAAYALGQIGRREATPTLIAALKDPSNIVRKTAADALGKMGERDAVEPLIDLLSDQERDTARVAAMALMRVGDRRAITPLREFARTEKSLVRRRRIRAAARSMERA
jgi:HEAT repeat protein